MTIVEMQPLYRIDHAGDIQMSRKAISYYCAVVGQSFDFTPCMVFLVWMTWNNGANCRGIFGLTLGGNQIMYPGMLTTDWTGSNAGFETENSGYSASCGKRSEDSRTIYWYNQRDASYQGNSAGYTYYAIAIG